MLAFSPEVLGDPGAVVVAAVARWTPQPTVTWWPRRWLRSRRAGPPVAAWRKHCWIGRRYSPTVAHRLRVSQRIFSMR